MEFLLSHLHTFYEFINFEGHYFGEEVIIKRPEGFSWIDFEKVVQGVYKQSQNKKGLANFG